jgi:hypothetical protein
LSFSGNRGHTTKRQSIQVCFGALFWNFAAAK